MLASEVVRAVAAARSAASSLGLVVDNADVLQSSNRLTVRLLPCDVLARVAPARDHEAQLLEAQFEVELAQRLAESVAPVGALEPRVEPKVYSTDGFVITLWTYYERGESGGGRTGRLRRCARPASCWHAYRRCPGAALHSSGRFG